MSYYGIKNLKIVELEDGFNVACSYYDSSIRDYNMQRVWHDTDRMLKNSMSSREELEDILFKDFLDGNLHSSGGCGKFTCLAWGNCKVTLSEEQIEELYNLEDRRWSDGKRNQQVIDEYYEKRYAYYKQAWKKYLEQEKLDKKTFKGNKFIIQLDYKDYKNIYVTSLGSAKVKYCYSEYSAKKFSGNPQKVLDKLAGFTGQENIRVVTLQN